MSIIEVDCRNGETDERQPTEAEAAQAQADDAAVQDRRTRDEARRSRRDQAVAMLNNMANTDPATWTKQQQRRMARVLALVVQRVDLDPGE